MAKLSVLNAARRGSSDPQGPCQRPSAPVGLPFDKNIYAQVIDDVQGVTLASASTLDKGLKIKNGGNTAAAAEVGKAVAERAKKAGVTEVIFDRGAYIFHGRVKALADAAREGGLQF